MCETTKPAQLGFSPEEVVVRQQEHCSEPSEAVLRQAARIFLGLSHPCRLRLLLALAGGQICDVTTLVDLCGRPQPYISQHLGVLRDAGLVVGEARSQRVCYRLASQQFMGVMEPDALRDTLNQLAQGG